MFEIQFYLEPQYTQGLGFQSKVEMFDYLLNNYGPDCKMEDGLWLGGWGTPRCVHGTIIGFQSDDEFNKEFSQFVKEECSFKVTCLQCNLPEHSCCCGGCVETY